MKCLASYRKKTIFSSVNFTKPNSSIKALHTGDIVIPTFNVPLQKDGLMSISSFGFGGLGGHIVIKQCNQEGDNSVSHPVLIPLSLHPFADPKRAKDEMKKRISDRAFYNYLLNSELCGGYTNPQRTFIIAEPETEFLHFSRCQNIELRVKQVIAVFSDFFTNPWTPHRNIISLPAVYMSLQKSEEVCKERHSGWLFDALASDPVPGPLHDGGLAMRVACQIAVADLMQELGISSHFNTIKGEGIGSLAAAYADGCLTRHQCMKAADVIEVTLRKENSNQKGTTLIQVELEENELYLLGPWVRIIRRYDNGKSLIAVLQNKEKEVQDLLNSNGDRFVVLDHHISVYSPLPKEVENNLSKQLGRVIPSPLMWSAKAEIASFKERGNFIKYCDAFFLTKMLTTPYEKFNGSTLLESLNHKETNASHAICRAQPDSDLKRSNSVEDIGFEFSTSEVKKRNERSTGSDSQGMFDNGVSETSSDDADETITLEFFVDGKQLSNSACPSDFVQETSMMSGSVPKGCNFVQIPANAVGFLSAAGHIHVAGYDIQASSLIGSDKDKQDTTYCGDFQSHLLWAWEHSAHGIDMDWRQKAKCGRNSKQEAVIEFSLQDYPIPEQLGLGLIAPMFKTVTMFLESELEDGKVLVLDNMKVIEIRSEDSFCDDVDKIYGRLFTQSHRFCVERVGHVSIQGHYEVIQHNPAHGMKGLNYPYAIVVNKPEEMLRNLFVLFKHLFDEISPLRLLWDSVQHDHILTKAMENVKHQRTNLKIPCSVDTNSGIIMCGGFILHSHCSKPCILDLRKPIKNSSLALVSSNEIARNSIENQRYGAQSAFYECLYQHQPTFIEMSEKDVNDEKRTPKQVRFSTDTRENEHEIIERPLTPGLLHNFRSVFSSLDSQDEFDYCEDPSSARPPSASSIDQKSETSERDVSSPIDAKYLAIALSSVRGENFRFVDCLDLDEMLTDTLLNMLLLFMPGTTLHVYIAPKTLSSLASPYVLYLSSECFVSNLMAPQATVLLRDRNTDLIEAFTSLPSAFSVVSTFVDDLYSSYEARVYAVMDMEGKENIPASSWEAVLLGEETKMLEDVMANYEHDVLQCHVPNCVTCMATSNELSRPRPHIVDKSSGCSSQSSSPSKRTSCFCLNLDSMFEKALNKLAVISGHVIAIVKPRDSSKRSETDTGQNMNTDEILWREKNLDGGSAQLRKELDFSSLETHDPNGRHSNDSLSFSDKRDSFNISDNKDSLSVPPKTLDTGTNISNDTKTDVDTDCQYMISLNKEHKSLVYLYSQANRDVVYFNDIKDLLTQLKKWHPQIDVTHEVLVSKLDDHSSFDESLYKFWHNEAVDISNNLMYNEESGERGKAGNEFYRSESPVFKDQNDVAPGENVAVLPMGKTPTSTVIPHIFVTPPLEKKSLSDNTTNTKDSEDQNNVAPVKSIDLLPVVQIPTSSAVPQMFLTPPLEEKSVSNIVMNNKHSEKKYKEGNEFYRNESPIFEGQSEVAPAQNVDMLPLEQTPTSTIIPQICVTPPLEENAHQSFDIQDEINDSSNSPINLETSQATDVMRKANKSPSQLEVPKDENDIDICARMPPVYIQQRVENKIKPTYFAFGGGIKQKKGLFGSFGINKGQAFKPVSGSDEDCSVEIMELVSESSELVSASTVVSASDLEVCKILEEENYSSLASDSRTASVSEQESDKNNEMLSSSIEETSKDLSSCVPHSDAKINLCLMVHLNDHKSPAGQQTGRTAGNLLMYVAHFDKEEKQVGRQETQCLGFLLFDELTLRHADFLVNNGLIFEHVESCIEMMVAMYILEELSLVQANDEKKKTVLIQPPIYRDPAFVMFLASHLKCEQIITSSSIPSVRDHLQNLIPNITVLSEPISRCSILPLTKGRGCDTVVMFNGQGIEEYLELVACSGSLIMCGKIDAMQDIGMSCFLRNITIHSLDVLHVVRHYMSLAGTQKQKFERVLWQHLHSLTDMVNVEFPPGNEGCFQSVLGRVMELPPMFEPEVNDIVQMFMSMTMSSSQVIGSVKEEQMQTLQYVYQVMSTAFSENCSMLTPSLKIQCVGSPNRDIENFNLNIPKEALRKRSSSVFHPEDFDYTWNEPIETETPIVKVVSCNLHCTTDENSLLDDEASERDNEKREQNKVPVLFSRGFQESAALQDVINSVDSDTIVELNFCHSGSPFFIVHPIMGTVKCFHTLAEKLPVPVYGIECTSQGYIKCKDGLKALARFYIEELVKTCPEGPIYLGGYSFGAVIAYEMAILLEKDSRVQQLLLLDGSLQYVKSHISYEMQFLAASESDHQKFVCAVLLSFVRLYLPDIPAHQAAALLLGSDNVERKIETAADLSLGFVKLGFKYGLKERWRLVSEKMKKKLRLESFRKSITSLRSNSISCNSCRLNLSEAVDGVHDWVETSEGCGICGNSRVAKGRVIQQTSELKKRESICENNCTEACQVIPELFMSEPACSLAETSERVMFSLRKRKAERFLQLALMVEDYEPEPLKKVPCTLIRVNAPPPFAYLSDLDLQYGLSKLVDDKNFQLLFMEGDHHSCLQYPYVAKLAEMIEKIFQV